MPDFMLDKRLAAVTVQLRDLPISRLLVMDDARYPWLVLVPRRAHLTEWHELEATDRIMVSEEIATVSAALKSLTRCHKINVANLGNVVAQLHIHVIARNPGDAAWPGPVWGQGEAVPYAPEALERFIEALIQRF